MTAAEQSIEEPMGTLLDVLGELDHILQKTPEPYRRQLAMLALGYTLGAVLRAGLTIQDIVALRAWPNQ